MNHLIQKQILDIHLTENIRAIEKQQAIRSLYWDRILPAMDKVFSELVPPNATLRLDQLSLDLGTIAIENLEREIIIQVKEQLSDAIIKIEQQEGTPLIRKKVIDGNKELLKNGSTEIKALAFFIKNGIYPWWFSGKDSLAPATLFDKIKKQSPQKIIELLRANVDAVFQKRVERQFALEQILSLVEVYQPSLAKVLLQIQKFFLKIKLPNKITDSQWKQVIDLALKRSSIFILKKSPTEKANQQGMVVYFLNQLAEISSLSSSELITFLKSEITNKEHKQSKEQKALLKTILHSSKITDSEKKNINFDSSLKKEAREIQSKNIEDILDEKAKQSELLEERAAAAEKADLSSSENVFQKNKINKDVEKNISKQSIKQAITDLLEEGIYIGNAGIVLLSPFFKMYFEKLGLLESQTFASKEKQERALQLTHYLTTGQSTLSENEIVLNKLLTGWPLEEPVNAHFEPTSEEIKESDALLRSVLEHWGALGKSGPQALQETFMLREAKLIDTSEQYKLIVERKTVDLLLDKIPWSFRAVKLSWMEKRLLVEW